MKTALQAVAMPSGSSVKTSPALTADDAIPQSLKVVVPVNAIESGLTAGSTV